MPDDETSIHRRLPRLLVELEEAFEVANDDPRRFAYWKLRNAAWKALDEGMRVASELIDVARCFKEADRRTSPDPTSGQPNE